MNIKYILKGLIAILLLSLTFSSCETFNEPLLDGIGNTREFSPIDLKAFVRNKTSVELNWTVKEGVNSYVVEFSEDPNFGTIYKSVEVTAAQLPVTVQLQGETTYSIRVKAKTSGLDDSKWSVTTATTQPEQIFLPIVPGDIQAKQATLRWIPNSDVTQIVLTPGNITRVITAAEKTSGIAIVTGLTAETAYTATLYNGTKKRGVQTFTTAVDIGNGILVKPTDDLLQVINNAAPGAALYLEPGDYTAQSGTITLAKTLTLRGLRSYDKPKVKLNFTLNSGVANFSLIDLDLTGSGVTNASVITVSTAATITDILISNCYIHDYTRSMFANTAGAARINSLTIDNCIVKNVNTNAGAEFIDVRTAYVKSVVLQNSTFDTCSDSREFIRLDQSSGLSGTGLTSSVLISSCTLYKVSTTVSGKRLLYVRFANNSSTVKNTLITDMPLGIYSNQNGTATPTTPPTFSNNNYFNAPLLYATGTAANTIDASGTYGILDPKFANATNGDFTITNQALKDKNVGDPRWIK
ncbi:DUF5123 domain-containing protein [Flavobacterium gilvum]|nr:DUF5123 domain-containing protein [Flavobacterium gilvum]